MKNNGSALHGGVMVRLGCGLLALVMLLGLLFAGGAFAYADNTEEVNALSAVDQANGFYVEVKGRSVPQGAALVLKPVSDDVLNYARNGRTLAEDEFFLMYDFCFKDYLGNELEVTPDGYHITVYFTEKGECFSSIDVAAVGGTLGELETKAANKLAEEAAAAEKAAAEEAVAAPAETTAPAEETTAPVEETTAPAEETTAPVEETTAPVTETTAPVAETTAPVAETTAPVEETTAPVEETTAPVEETTAPAEETTAPAEETTAPAEETTAPAEETTAPAEETPVADRNLKTSEVHIADLYNGNHYVTFNTDGLGILKFTGTSYNVNDLPIEETAEPATLYDRLMACETLDEVNAILDNLTEEENAEMEAFTDEQNAALSEKMCALDAYGVEELAYRYTIVQGGRQSVTSGHSIDNRSLTFVVDPSTSGNRSTISVVRGDNGTSYTISVGRNVPVGDYTVTVTYTTTSSRPSTTETHTETFIVHVVASSTGEKYSQSYYANPGPEHVAWDVVGKYGTSSGNPTGGMDNAGSYVKSVKMSNIDVAWAESDREYPYPGRNNSSPTRAGETLDKYFGAEVTSSTASKDAVLTIEPQPGYYVTGYWIVCANNKTPYDCAVLKDGNEHHASFTFAESGGGAVQDTVWSEYFGHPDDRDDQYFILVSVAPVPTPLFVEYNYGIIKDEVTEADKGIFTSPVIWTTIASGNVYGQGNVDTPNIQYRYAYNAGNPAEASNWKHNANTVTDAAKQAAANAGYYFAGWKAEYYTDANAQSIRNDADGRNYDYNMSSKYGSDIYYTEGLSVSLISHVKLIAQWKPIELEVKKTVSGLTEDFSGEHTYKIQVQKLADDGTTWNNYGDVQSIIVNGNSSNSAILSAITPGTYRAVEAEESKVNLSNETTIMYLKVDESGKVTYSASEIKHSQTLEVKNTYEDKPAAYDLTVKKTLSGNMYSENDKFTFTVKYGDVTDTFELGNNGEKTISVPVGAEVTVTENPGSYKYSLTSIVPTVTKTDVNNGVKFIMPSNHVTVTINNDYTVNLDTGVSLDSLPYILILGVVVVGAVVIVVSRSKHRRDY